MRPGVILILQAKLYSQKITQRKAHTVMVFPLKFLNEKPLWFFLCKLLNEKPL
jgi:hypothetical protein